MYQHFVDTRSYTVKLTTCFTFHFIIRCTLPAGVFFKFHVLPWHLRKNHIVWNWPLKYFFKVYHKNLYMYRGIYYSFSQYNVHYKITFSFQLKISVPSQHSNIKKRYYEDKTFKNPYKIPQAGSVLIKFVPHVHLFSKVFSVFSCGTAEKD